MPVVLYSLELAGGGHNVVARDIEDEYRVRRVPVTMIRRAGSSDHVR